MHYPTQTSSSQRTLWEEEVWVWDVTSLHLRAHAGMLNAEMLNAAAWHNGYHCKTLESHATTSAVIINTSLPWCVHVCVL